MPLDSWVSYELNWKTLSYLSIFFFNRDSYTKFNTDPFSCIPQDQNIYLILLRLLNLYM